MSGRPLIETTGTLRRRVGPRNLFAPALSTTVTETREGMTFRVTILIPATYKCVPGCDWIKIHTSHPGMPELRIPIKQREAPNLPPPALTVTPTAAESTAYTASARIKIDRIAGAEPKSFRRNEHELKAVVVRQLAVWRM